MKYNFSRYRSTHGHLNKLAIKSRALWPLLFCYINRLREILFPGYFSRGKVDPVNLKYTVGQAAAPLFDMLSEQICHSIRHDCLRYDQACSECDEQGYQSALQFLEAIPALRIALAADIRATYHGDPAAKIGRSFVIDHGTGVVIETPRLIYKSKKQKPLRQAFKAAP